MNQDHSRPTIEELNQESQPSIFNPRELQTIRDTAIPAGRFAGVDVNPAAKLGALMLFVTGAETVIEFMDRLINVGVPRHQVLEMFYSMATWMLACHRRFELDDDRHRIIFSAISCFEHRGIDETEDKNTMNESSEEKDTYISRQELKCQHLRNLLKAQLKKLRHAYRQNEAKQTNTLKNGELPDKKSSRVNLEAELDAIKEAENGVEAMKRGRSDDAALEPEKLDEMPVNDLRSAEGLTNEKIILPTKDGIEPCDEAMAALALVDQDPSTNQTGQGSPADDANEMAREDDSEAEAENEAGQPGDMDQNEDEEDEHADEEEEQEGAEENLPGQRRFLGLDYLMSDIQEIQETRLPAMGRILKEVDQYINACPLKETPNCLERLPSALQQLSEQFDEELGDVDETIHAAYEDFQQLAARCQQLGCLPPAEIRDLVDNAFQRYYRDMTPDSCTSHMPTHVFPDRFPEYESLSHEQQYVVDFQLGEHQLLKVYGPFGSGKTTALTNRAVKRAQEGAHVLFLHNDAEPLNNPPPNLVFVTYDEAERLFCNTQLPPNPLIKGEELMKSDLTRNVIEPYLLPIPEEVVETMRNALNEGKNRRPFVSHRAYKIFLKSFLKQKSSQNEFNTTV